MTYPLESKFTTLRKNAQRYYDAVIFPCHPDQFDSWNPRPRIALNIELARIAERERKDGGRGW